MAAKLRHCPFDGSTQISVIRFNNHFRARCETCGAEGPEMGSWAEAEKAWNTRVEPSTDGDGGEA